MVLRRDVFQGAYDLTVILHRWWGYQHRLLYMLMNVLHNAAQLLAVRRRNLSSCRVLFCTCLGFLPQLLVMSVEFQIDAIHFVVGRRRCQGLAWRRQIVVSVPFV